MHRLESTSNALDSSYYMAVGEEDTHPSYEVRENTPTTDEADESETEAVWSDMDLEANSQ